MQTPNDRTCPVRDGHHNYAAVRRLDTTGDVLKTGRAAGSLAAFHHIGVKRLCAGAERMKSSRREWMVLQNLIRRASNGDRATEATTEKKAPALPSVGLALGGGAARGFAHIGILRVLEANGIVPDVVVGTSIGAAAGACYAGGQLDAFEDWARHLTKRGVLGYLDINFAGSGLISGSRLAARLEQTLGDTLIEDLPKRFAAIATELGTGHEIWLTRGRVVDAARASYALPGIFSPIRVGGRWLVDGALVNPVPVSAARALGARLVIGVNLNADLMGRGGTISSHGPDETDALALEQLRSREGQLARMFSLEHLLKRQFMGATPQPEYLERDDRRLQHHAGPHHAVAARRRSARRHDQSAAGAGRIVRLPSRQGSDRARHRRPPNAPFPISPRRSRRWRN